MDGMTDKKTNAIPSRKNRSMQLETKIQIAARQGRMGCAAAVLITIAVVSAACTPTYNWRTVSLGDLAMQAQLPCKPDQTTQSVPMGKTQVALHAAGCEQANAHWSVMATRLASEEDAQYVLAQWQQLTLRHMQAVAVQKPEKLQAVQSAVFVVGADPQQGFAHASWRTLQVAQETYIVQAMVLYQRSENNNTTLQEARANFHDSIRENKRL
jgi:hypothetical protein